MAAVYEGECEGVALSALSAPTEWESEKTFGDVSGLSVVLSCAKGMIQVVATPKPATEYKYKALFDNNLLDRVGFGPRMDFDKRLKLVVAALGGADSLSATLKADSGGMKLMARVPIAGFHVDYSLPLERVPLDHIDILKAKLQTTDQQLVESRALVADLQQKLQQTKEALAESRSKLTMELSDVRAQAAAERRPAELKLVAANEDNGELKVAMIVFVKANVHSVDWELREAVFNASLIYGLCLVLGEETAEMRVRQYAGYYLKRLVGGTGKTSEAAFAKFKDKWNTTETKIKNVVKEQALSAFEQNNREVSSAAVLIVTYVAKVEGLDGWRTLVPSLIRLFEPGFRDKKPYTLKAVFQTLGFLAEECDETHMKLFAKSLFCCIKCGMQVQGSVRMVVLKCLKKSLHLFADAMQAKGNEVKVTVQFLMVCAGSTRPEDSELRVLAWKTLTDALVHYYAELRYFVPTIFAKSVETIENGIRNGDADENVEATKRAIKFWTTCAEIESMNIEFNKSLAKSGSKALPAPFLGYCLKAAPRLIPHYLKALKRHEFDADDEDEMDLRKVSGNSLEMFATVMGDSILSAVIPFVKANIGSDNWELREAALCAFGMVLDGLTPDKVEAMVHELLPICLRQMTGREHLHLARTAAWLFAKICSNVPRSTLPLRGSFIEPLLTAINGPSCVSHYGCWTLSSLAKFYSEAKMDTEPLRQGKAVEPILLALVARSKREDATLHAISGCFQCINDIVTFGPDGDESFNEVMVRMIQPLLGDLVALAMNPDALRSSEVKQSKMVNYVTTLGVCLKKVENLERVALDETGCDKLMRALLNVANMSPIMLEEVLMCMSYLCFMLKEKFYKHMKNPGVQKILLDAVDLATHKNVTLCMIGSGVAGDCLLACASKLSMGVEEFLRFTDELVQRLLTLLVHNAFPLRRKTCLIGTLTDLGIAFGRQWRRYVKEAMTNSFMVSNENAPEDADALEMDSWNELRAEVIGMCHATAELALTESGDIDDFQYILPNILRLLDVVASDSLTSKLVFEDCLEFLDTVVRDIGGHRDGGRFVKQFLCPTVKKFLTAASSKDPSLAEMARLVDNDLNRFSAD